MSTLLRRLVVAAASVALVASVVAAPTARADTAVKPLDGVITVEGAGWGHGIGMSQYGAWGAAKAGLSYASILKFYYSGVSIGSLPSGNTIRVWIKKDDDSRLTVRPASGLRLKNLSSGSTKSLPTGSKYRYWQLRISNGDQRLYYKNSSGSYVRTTWQPTSGQVWWFENWNVGYVQVVLPGGTVKDYRHRVTLRRYGSGARTVNRLTMEQYLKSVVPSEMPTFWHREAVKAQAVAARSYAARTRAGVSSSAVYDICDDTYCQVYKGLATRTKSGRTVNEYSASNAAVSGTVNKVVTYGGSVALTMFSSSNGGYSAPGPHAYLKPKADPYDNDIKSQTWTKSLTTATIKKAFPSIGTPISVQVTKRDGYGSWGGRVETVVIRGTLGSKTVTGGTFKRTFGLKERLFVLKGATVTTT